MPSEMTVKLRSSRGTKAMDGMAECVHAVENVTQV
jgi:hypothetical protein